MSTLSHQCLNPGFMTSSTIDLVHRGHNVYVACAACFELGLSVKLGLAIFFEHGDRSQQEWNSLNDPIPLPEKNGRYSRQHFMHELTMLFHVNDGALSEDLEAMIQIIVDAEFFRDGGERGVLLVEPRDIAVGGAA